MAVQRFRTVCPRDCYDTCGVIAEVEDGRLVRISGDPEHGVTRGFLCPKGLSYVEQVYHPDRLLRPRVKRGSEWADVGWDEALDLVAAQLLDAKERFGPLAILHYWDYGSMGVLRELDRRFFNALGGVTNPSGSLCSAAGIAALTYDYGRRHAHDPEDMTNSRLIVLWGKNPADTSVHFMPILEAARQRGARVVLIDPLKTRTAAYADWHLAPRPGTDGALALSIAHVIIENEWHDEAYIHDHVFGFDAYADMVRDFTPEKAAAVCDIPEADLYELARLYASTHPAAIWMGFGIQRYTNGGATVRAIDALTAITGNIGVQGGGTGYSHGDAQQYHSVNGSGMATNRRTIPKAGLGKGVLECSDPEIQAMVVTRANPACQSPDLARVREAFTKVPFVVVVDSFMTDTAELADVVLPCTNFLEEEDVYFSYWHNWIGYGPRIIDPPGEARPEHWIFTELARRCGVGHAFGRTPREWLQHALKPMAKDGVTLERLEQGPMRHPGVPAVPWSDGRFETPSGRFELYSQKAEKDGLDPLPRFVPPVESTLNPDSAYPLQFLSTQPRTQTHSQFANLESRRRNPDPVVRLHPDTAAHRGLADGQWVEVVSPRGSMRARLSFDEGLRRDVCATTNGHWIKHGGGVNFLTPDTMSDMGLQAALYDCVCEVKSLRMER